MKRIAALLLLSTLCLAQTRILTVTRSVQQFGELERKLAEAKDSEDKAALLTDDFEERLCAEPGTPISRADWLKQPHPDAARFSQPAVHIYGDIALVSALFAHDQKSEMIVDTWKQVEGSWKLAVRYRCPASGSKPAESAIPKRY